MMARQTLEQQRAAYAWTAARRAQHGFCRLDDLRHLTKGAHALITGQGLMPALALYASRKADPCAELLGDTIRGWLNERFGAQAVLGCPGPATYAELMDRLLRSPSAFHMQAMDETLALLKWLHQFAAALGR